MGFTIDRELKFDKHDSKIYSKASTVLGRMSKFLTFEKRKTIFNVFIADIWIIKSISYTKEH